MSIVRIIHLTLLIVCFTYSGVSQGLDSSAMSGIDTNVSNQLSIDSSLIAIDSLSIDTSMTDTMAFDSLKPPPRKSSLDHPVLYNSEDSMIIDMINDKVYLYGSAVAEYGDIKLEADFIEISLGTSELRATGMPDSAGEMVGFPKFTQGESVFDSEEMRYNFKSKRGLSKSVKTQDGAEPNISYIHGEWVKKDTGKVIYIQNGKYTTCSYDDPHYHIHAGKLKVITEDKIVTGPAYLSFANVPTPLAVPFGFFPNSDKRANGILIPSWGETRGLGLSLNGGGYYFGIGDVADVSLTADIFSRGSWNGYMNTNYVKRYKNSGNFGLQLIKRIVGEPEFPNYQNLPLRYRIAWNHRQDPKAKPGRNFSASVDFGSPDGDRLNANSTQTRQLRNSTKSSINYQKSFANSPFAFRAAASSDQNARTGNVNVQLPNAALTMNRIYPFKRKVPVGNEKPWEKIQLSGTLEGKNQVTAPFERLFTDSTLNEMRNGVHASLPVNAQFKVLKYFTLSPKISNDFYGQRQTVRQTWNPADSTITETKVNELAGYWDGGASVDLRTVLYGIYNYKSELIKAMRHQLTPAVGYRYKPDFSDPFWGYFDTVQYNEFGSERLYSKYATGIYGGPSAKENGVLTFSLANTFEMKVKNLADSTEEGSDKKLRLIDALGFNTSYNIAKDSNNWAPLTMNFRSTVVPGVNIQAGATLNPYAWNNTTGVQEADYWFERNGKIGKWTRANARASYQLRPKGSKKKTDKKKKDLADRGLYYDDFVDFDIPWSASVTYNIQFTRTAFTEDISQFIEFGGDVNFTRNWKAGFDLRFDVTAEQLTAATFNFYRDLHCWEMRFSATPFGLYQRYDFGISVKAPMLQDLKLNRNRTFSVPTR